MRDKIMICAVCFILVSFGALIGGVLTWIWTPDHSDLAFKIGMTGIVGLLTSALLIDLTGG